MAVNQNICQIIVIEPCSLRHSFAPRSDETVRQKPAVSQQTLYLHLVQKPDVSPVGRVSSERNPTFSFPRIAASETVTLTVALEQEAAPTVGKAPAASDLPLLVLLVFITQVSLISTFPCIFSCPLLFLLLLLFTSPWCPSSDPPIITGNSGDCKRDEIQEVLDRSAIVTTLSCVFQVAEIWVSLWT